MTDATSRRRSTSEGAKLWAISDLHVGYEENRRAVQALPSFPDDWLIIAGDTGETPAHLDFVLRTLQPRFAQLVWTPGNHDLWTPKTLASDQRGVAHYERLVSLCRQLRRADAGRSLRALARRRPHPRDRADVPAVRLFVSPALGDARAGRRLGRRPPACARRMKICSRRIRMRRATTGAPPASSRPRRGSRRCRTGVKLIVANHFPLRADLAVLPRIPRFSIWCGTTRTNDWHRRFNIEAVVYGHLHLRSSRTDRRRPLRGSVAGVSEAVEPAEAARALPATDPLTWAGRCLAPTIVRRGQTLRRRSAAARSVSSFFAKQKRNTGPPVSL